MSVALALALSLAAGAVVDAAAASDVRASYVGREDEPPVGLYTLTLRPGLRFAAESDGAAIDVGYAPQLSLVTPSRRLLIALHTATLGTEVPINRRLSFRARATGSFGDLDPGTAQQQLFNSLTVVDETQPVSYASAALEATLAARLSPTATMDLNASVIAQGSPEPADDPFDGQEALRPTVRNAHQETLGPRFAFFLTRRDAVFLDAQLRAITIVDGGLYGDARALGLLGAVGWRRQLLQGIATELRVGALNAVADAGNKRGLAFVTLPLVDTRTAATLDLGGNAALDAELLAGITPSTDPQGALLEDRFTTQFTLAWRMTRDFALRGSLFAAAPLFAFGGQPPALAGTGASATIAWAFVDNAALELGAQTQSRVAGPDRRHQSLFMDVTFLAGVTSTFNVWSLGSRPAGTDARPGRGVGEGRIGSTPPPQMQTGPAEPEPLEEIEELPPPESLPPELVPPPVNPPLELDIVDEPAEGDGKDPKKKRPRPKPKKPPAEGAPVDAPRDAPKETP